MHVILSTKFGDKLYCGETSTEWHLNTSEAWAIKNPNQDVIRTFPGCELRQHNGFKYLLTPKACSFTPTKQHEYNGSAVVIHTEKDVILVADNKPYLQNCQGMRLDSETDPRATAVREIQEELNITVDPRDLVEIGYYTFKNYCALVETTFIAKTVVFALKTDILPVAEKNDEVEFGVIIPISGLADAPEKINGKAFNGHHRQILYDHFGIAAKPYDMPYLDSYEITSQTKNMGII